MLKNSTAFSRLSARLFRSALDSRVFTEQSPIVLVAARNKDSYELVHGIVATAVAAERDARIVAFRFGDGPTLSRRAGRAWSRLSRAKASTDPYLDFSDEATVLWPSWSDGIRARVAVRRYASSSPSRRDLELFEISGIRVGDLVFDAFVAGGGGAAVDPVDPEVLRLLKVHATRALTVRRFISSHPCVAVILKDVAYSIGIPGRVALHLGVDAFAVSTGWCDRLSPERPDKELVHLSYPTELEQMSIDGRLSARRLGQDFLSGRLASGSGGFSVTGVDVWGRSGGTVPVPPSRSRATVLVAPHSFTDAQHAGGVGLFSDSFSWLEFLHSVAEQTDYFWLIKLHPDQRDAKAGYREEVEELFADREDVHVLGVDVHHDQLLDRGIDVVLTVYGTIAMEYPARGIPAITARPDNPHSGFSYALHPHSVEEYLEILLDKERWRYAIPNDEIWEYAYLHYLVSVNVFEEWGPDYSSAPQSVPAGESLVHAAWEALDDSRLAQILDVCRSWVRSGDYSLHRHAALREGGHAALLQRLRSHGTATGA